MTAKYHRDPINRLRSRQGQIWSFCGNQVQITPKWTFQSGRISNLSKILFLFGFNGPSRLFHSFWAESVIRWGENRKSPRKTDKQVILQARSNIDIFSNQGQITEVNSQIWWNFKLVQVFIPVLTNLPLSFIKFQLKVHWLCPTQGQKYTIFALKGK